MVPSYQAIVRYARAIMFAVRVDRSSVSIFSRKAVVQRTIISRPIEMIVIS